MKTNPFLPLLMGISVIAGISPKTHGESTGAETSPVHPTENSMPSVIFKKSKQAGILDRMTFRHLSSLLQQEGVEENPAMSPVAMACAFEALRLGASGETEKELGLLLGYADGSATPKVEEANSIWSWAVRHPEGQGWKLAHGLWYHEKHPLLPSYLKSAGTLPSLEISAANFGEPDAFELLSAWSKKHSGGKLGEPVPASSIHDLTRLVWISLLHYQGKWAEPFDAKRSKPGVFHASGGDIQVMMMHGEMHAAVTRHEGYGTVAALPMEGGKTVLEVRIPEKLNSRKSWPEWLSKTMPGEELPAATKLPVIFPRVNLKSRLSWKPVLEALGAKNLLSDADFSKATEEGGLRLTELSTETSIRFDESGAEVASSASAVVGVRGVSSKLEELRLDRPFVWIIRDAESGVPVAAGLIERPSLATPEQVRASGNETPAAESPAQ